MPSESTPVAILGAGLTGMSAAWHLRAAGIPFRIFERQNRAGGHVVTEEDSGFRFDKTGHLLHLRDPAMRELVSGWLRNDVLEVQRRSMIWSHGTYTRYPFQANTLGLPPAVAYECVMGFLRARDTQWPAAPRDFEQFCLQHFGEGFSKHFMIPYNCRLWGVHPRDITAAWCSRFVPIPKLEDVIAGAVGLARPELGYNASFLYPRRGIGELTRTMAQALPEIELARVPVRVDTASRRIDFADGASVTYDQLISTAPLDRLCALMTDAPEAVRTAASLLRCNPLWYLDVALSVPAGKPYHWVYVPEERYPFYRIGCYSNFSPDLAPPGCSNLYIELADRAEPNLNTLGPQIETALVEMGWIDHPGQVAFLRKRKLEHAYVIFDHHYFDAVDVIHGWLRQQRIQSVGRYGGWNYSSMEDALMFGRDAAALAARQMR